MRFEQLYEGQTFTTEKHLVTLEEMLSFAKNYDPQLLHTDPSFAEKSMFGGLIASGLLTLSIGWGLFIRADILGADSRGGIGMDDIRFLAPVYPGDSLYAEVAIENLRPSRTKPDLGVITMLFSIKNQHDKPVATCKIIGYVARESAGGNKGAKKQ